MDIQLYSKESEDDVISSIMIKPELIDDLSVKPLHFFQHKHRYLLKTMISMRDEQIPIDISTLADRLKREGHLKTAGNVTGLLEFMNMAFTTTIENLRYKEKIIKENHQYRSLLDLSKELQDIAREQRDLSEVALVADKLTNIDSFEQNKRESIKDVLVKVYDNIESRSSQLQDVTGIKTGFSDVDRILNGLHETELSIVAARPSIGKTALALNFGTGITKSSRAIPVIYSLETTSEKLVERQLVATGNLDAQRVRTGHIAEAEWRRITYAMGELSNKEMFYHDLSRCTPGYIRSDLKQLKKQFPDRNFVAIIDHLQLMSSDRREPNRNLEVGAITRDLKMIAKDLDVHVMLLSQLSRGVESRQDKRPMMSDLRDSGEVEQNADVIAFLYRDDYYDKESENQNILEFIVAKQRNGPVGTVQLAFMKEMNKFVNLERRLDHADQAVV
ncbi:replicative DNA helicase [Jeotgalibacillus aurantiacus]|uniref:replicative DNA helicase n=1 Tax=Jeotgalibacillus aurantiacus TaxID=2763266 RepID=UPI001D0AFC9C|nr:replicative DNA helicase [Jeotgalibacillus aurantiacus]